MRAAGPAPWLVLALACAHARAGAPPLCRTADAVLGSVDAHVADWDTQIEFGLNTSLNCSSFLEFVFLSRERIKIQLGYVRGNFSAQDAQARADGEDGIATALVMSHMSSAASLVSAQTHIHGVLAAARRECLSEHLQLLFLMSLSRRPPQA
ncbi:unnamed protein product [Prorocentrum cordatum]|uniref:Uncharacterized protein n=1 Tax=Prorocentrum cordatum TaxID=2364126 RepID=A0ABN9SH60_9DINO|nr:unnamed protein product [Polarella glacialis]